LSSSANADYPQDVRWFADANSSAVGVVTELCA
jgi:hypothetical protein